MMSSFFAPPSSGPTDEEVEHKKDDDRATGIDGGTQHWAQWLKSLLRMRKRRLFLLAGAVLTIWFLFTHRLQGMLSQEDGSGAGGRGANIDIDDFSQWDGAGWTGSNRRPNRPAWDNGAKGPGDGIPPPQIFGPQPRKGQAPWKSKATDTKFYYDGTMRFFSLPKSLQRISRTGGYRPNNRNVLFAAAAPRSAGTLIPIACAMADAGTNYVHFIFLGRDDSDIREILEANGIDTKCRVYFHDGRPDYSPYSSDWRAETAVLTALGHVQEYMHPQAVVMDSANSEEGFLIRGLKAKAKDLSWPVIEIPPLDPQAQRRTGRPSDSLSWIARLEPSSLAAWHRPDVEILISAHSQSAGSLIRLLRSLSDADYSGIAPPRLTIELPSEVDPILTSFLFEYKWPPENRLTTTRDSPLTLRKRIPLHGVTPEEAAIRFVEGFYPAKPAHSHVLLLSPQAEVSPLFYQHVRYYLLKYRYGINHNNYPPVMGIGLDMPMLHVNGSAAFVPPSLDDLEANVVTDTRPVSKSVRPTFLWEAPNAGAALYFGDAWAEFHSFLTLRLQQFHGKDGAIPKKKVVGGHLPTWAEFMLEFMRARGASLMYPGAVSSKEAFVTVHNEMHHGPEEFESRGKPVPNRKRAAGDTPDGPSDPAIPAPGADSSASDTGRASSPFAEPLRRELPSVPLHKSSADESSFTPTYEPLLSLLPFKSADLPVWIMPHLAWDGEKIAEENAQQHIDDGAEAFRKETGGCADVKPPKGMKKRPTPGSSRDLFCFGEDEVEWEVDEFALRDMFAWRSEAKGDTAAGQDGIDLLSADAPPEKPAVVEKGATADRERDI
jgi:hypothetical protein